MIFYLSKLKFIFSELNMMVELVEAINNLSNQQQEIIDLLGSIKDELNPWGASTFASGIQHEMELQKLTLESIEGSIDLHSSSIINAISDVSDDISDIEFN